ncbi:MAG TPA: hypothetical protein VLB90_02515 [Pseudomonadales bacterium]|nr:hypothetical protein [Pseudomonadales bacterium]
MFRYQSMLRQFFAAILLLATLTACGGKLTQENFNKIDNGMPYAEVVKILGKPQSSEGGGVLGITAGASVWKDDKHQISITFINEKVASKTFSEIKPAATESQ